MKLGPWLLDKDGNGQLRELFNRHYSARKYKDGRNPRLFVGPGEKLVLTTPKYDALFVWRKFIDHAEPYQEGVNCAVFRNESSMLSSWLILEAESWAWERWPGERLYTYINIKKIRSTNPGYCFLSAGWEKCGKTKGGLIILEKLCGPL